MTDQDEVVVDFNLSGRVRTSARTVQKLCQSILEHREDYLPILNRISGLKVAPMEKPDHDAWLQEEKQSARPRRSGVPTPERIVELLVEQMGDQDELQFTYAHIGLWNGDAASIDAVWDKTRRWSKDGKRQQPSAYGTQLRKDTLGALAIMESKGYRIDVNGSTRKIFTIRSPP